MDEKQKLVFGTAAIIGGSIIVAAYLAAPPRYSLATTDSVAYRLDRSTGQVFACGYGECFPQEMAAPRSGDANTTMDANNTAASDMAIDPMMDANATDMGMDTNMTMDANVVTAPYNSN